MINKPRVFLVVNLLALDTHYCLGNLPNFGKIVWLYDSVPDMWHPSFEGNTLVRFEWAKFDPDLDFYAVSGIMPLSHVALGVLIDEYGAIKTLLWDREQYKYREKIIGGLEADVQRNN